MDAETYEDLHQITPILEEAKNVILDLKPENPLQFLADFFLLLQSRSEDSIIFDNLKEIAQEIKLELQDKAPEISNSPPLFQRLIPFGGPNASLRKRSRQEFDIGKPVVIGSNGIANVPAPPIGFSRARRGSVSAESIQPSDQSKPKVIIPKSMEAKIRIASATSSNLLFRNLEDEQKRSIVDAMFEKLVKPGEIVIKQGDEGDNFYVVDEGIFDIYVNDRKVIEVHPGGSFGELALMYNTSRAATVKAITTGVLWAVDRVTFREIITDNTYRKRRLYESFLRTVPILESLEPSEIAKISDALEPVTFEPEDTIIEQGSPGDYFYMIEEGQVRVVQTIESGEEIELPGLQVGDYFGELALLNDAPRMVSVIANSDVKLVALSKDAFVRLLGPVVDIMKRNVSKYTTADGILLSSGGIME